MKKILVLLTLFAILLSACSSLATSELERNRSKWQAANISHYRMVLTVGCFCAFRSNMPLSIEVKDGKVISMIFNDGTPVPDSDKEIFSHYNDISTLFDFTKDVLQKADQVDIQYDSKYGFPMVVQIDYMKNAVDDELTLTIESFEPQ